MWSVPVPLEHRAAVVSLLIEKFAEISRVGSLIHNLGLGAGLCPVLVRRTCDFLTGSRNVSEAMIVRNINHWQRRQSGRKTKR